MSKKDVSNVDKALDAWEDCVRQWQILPVGQTPSVRYAVAPRLDYEMNINPDTPLVLHDDIEDAKMALRVKVICAILAVV